MRREAAFRCSTPLEVALERAFSAAGRAALAAAASPLAIASRTFFTAFFTLVRTCVLRALRFWACRLRLMAEGVFAKSCSRLWRAGYLPPIASLVKGLRLPRGCPPARWARRARGAGARRGLEPCGPPRRVARGPFCSKGLSNV